MHFFLSAMNKARASSIIKLVKIAHVYSLGSCEGMLPSAYYGQERRKFSLLVSTKPADLSEMLRVTMFKDIEYTNGRSGLISEENGIAALRVKCFLQIVSLGFVRPDDRIHCNP